MVRSVVLALPSSRERVWDEPCLGWLTTQDRATRPPNKGMKQTSVEHIGRSQLIPGVGQTVAKSIMARIAGLALLSIAFTAVCGYRPCAGPPTRLLGSLVSQATPEQAKATLRPGQWVVEREEPGPTDGRPPFAFKTVDVGEIVDLGHRGRLRLVFYNGRLASALFTPDDASAYFAQVQGLEGAAMLPGGIVSLGSATRVTRLGLSKEGPVIEWYDACLRADQDAWIARYA